jgi:PTH1 family peptidyl-tRNA hydrolase
LFLVKPLTFMNRSGEVIKSVLRQAKASLTDFLIVCDNLDLELGVLKLKQTGSSGGHRGLESIFAFAKTTDIGRFTIGIGRPQRRGGVIDHVLGVPDDEELSILDDAVGRAVSFILRLLAEPIEKVMSEVNRRAGKDDPA